MADITEVKTTNGSAPNPATNVKTEATPAPKLRAKLITKEELSNRIDSVQVVNVLDPQFYNLGFIKGSKRIPLDKIDARLGELDKSKEVVTYCASTECHKSMHAAEKLAALGFNVSAYEGGIKEWKEAGLPTEE